MDVPREGLDVRTVLVDHLWVRPLQLRDELRDVVDLRVVDDARAHLPESKRLISVVPAVLKVRAILELLLGWKLEHLLANGKLFIDLLLRQAEVDDVEKSCSRRQST